MNLVGIDIGGSGIKAALVDIETGQISGERLRVDTPSGAIPADIARVIGEVAKHFNAQAAIGCTFPAIVQHGVTLSAANVDKSWIGTDAKALFEKSAGCPVHVLNDADAAGLAEIKFGAGKGRTGTVIMLTFGTGIGSALFLDGKLVPNTEFGHLQIRGKDAEHRSSAKIKEDKDLSWEKWSQRVNEFLAHLEFLFSPDLFIIGGGISKKHDKFLPLLKTRAQIVPAQFFNDAGIIGAAVAASQLLPVDSERKPASSAETPSPPTERVRRTRSRTNAQ